VTRGPLSDEVVELLAERLALLSQPTRIRLLCLIEEHGELTVQRLAGRVSAPVQTVSEHLNRLAGAGLLVRRREGREIHYALAEPGILGVYRTTLRALEAGAPSADDRRAA